MFPGVSVLYVYLRTDVYAMWLWQYIYIYTYISSWSTKACLKDQFLDVGFQSWLREVIWSLCSVMRKRGWASMVSGHIIYHHFWSNSEWIESIGPEKSFFSFRGTPYIISSDAGIEISIPYMGVSKNRGGPPKWMVKIMENPIKMDDLGISHYFRKHPYPGEVGSPSMKSIPYVFFGSFLGYGVVQTHLSCSGRWGPRLAACWTVLQ